MKESTRKPQKDYYGQLDTAIKSYEEYKPYHQYDFSWICDRINWCRKFGHIDKEQTEELCDRMVRVMKEYS